MRAPTLVLEQTRNVVTRVLGLNLVHERIKYAINLPVKVRDFSVPISVGLVNH